MRGKPQPLKSWVRVDLDDARIARQWGNITASLDRRRPSWFWGVALSGAAVAAAAGGIWFWQSGRAKHQDVVAVEASKLRLADGSVVALEPGANLAIRTNEALHVETSLESGGAFFDVVPNHERAFSVWADGVEVRVVGTQFRVAVDPGTRDVTVGVTRGIVEVRTSSPTSDVRRLEAGESWTVHRSSSVSVPSATRVETPSAAPVEPTASAAARVDIPTDSAKQLFDAANQARRAGNLARASALYRELCDKHPDDPRAKVAALELARVEMDRDPGSSVAEDALHTASSADVGSSVHEDALARLVQLYTSKKDLPACRDAKARYLAAYPTGVHAAQVRAACEP